jgi:hypothetical protein
VNMSACELRGAQAGMTSINDFATTYMCQSLPFGGVKHSGFDRFGGVEGLRGLCVPKAVAEDRWGPKHEYVCMLCHRMYDQRLGCCIAMFTARSPCHVHCDVELPHCSKCRSLHLYVTSIIFQLTSGALSLCSS